MDAEYRKQRTAQLLGWAGLIPFPALALAPFFAPNIAWLDGLASYALAIISFLAGAWWGIALLRRAYRMLIWSNAIVIAAWFGYLLDRGLFLPLAACLLYLLYRVEEHHTLFSPAPLYYRQLRLRLTAVAALSLLGGFALL